MLFYFSISGIFLSVVLLYFGISRKVAGIYLAIFGFLISWYCAGQTGAIYSKSILWSAIIYAGITFPGYLLGPVSYWYTRSILRDDIRLTKRDFWHFLPLVIYLTALIPCLLTSYAHKPETAGSIVSVSGFSETYHETILSDLFSTSAIYLSRPFLLLIYLCWSVGMFAGYKYKERKSSVFPRHHNLDNWLVVFFGSQLIVLISHLLAALSILKPGFSGLVYTADFSRMVSFIGLAGIILLPLFFPAILLGWPGSAPVPPAPPESVGDEAMILRGTKKTIPDFELSYMLSIVQKMTTCMQEENLYLHSDCNLAQLAVAIDIPAHHLAFFFREIKKQSFNDYRNECRVNHAKNLILAGKSEEITLEAIGILSGFTNRNTFFNAFKKVEGISPGAFATQAGK